MEKKRISMWVEVSVLEKFKRAAQKEDLPVAYLIRRAMREWLAKREAKNG